MIRNSLAILPTKQTESSLECILLQSKIKVKRDELQMLKEELIRTLQVGQYEFCFTFLKIFMTNIIF